ncbi:MAG: hypothetical protein NC114_06810 [Ruminococcus flavefaciens]|nr:hypothetical protein [Ruminococcus flavefaciens]
MWPIIRIGDINKEFQKQYHGTLSVDSENITPIAVIKLAGDRAYSIAVVLDYFDVDEYSIAEEFGGNLPGIALYPIIISDTKEVPYLNDITIELFTEGRTKDRFVNKLWQLRFDTVGESDTTDFAARLLTTLRMSADMPIYTIENGPVRMTDPNIVIDSVIVDEKAVLNFAAVCKNYLKTHNIQMD